MLLLWDGLGFMGFATSKLERLRGEKVTWLTPITNLQSIISIFLLIGVSIYIGATEVSKLDKKKSQTTNFI